jgi:ABC-type transport system involved in cytochrome c biogenesis permease subunit
MVTTSLIAALLIAALAALVVSAVVGFGAILASLSGRAPASIPHVPDSSSAAGRAPATERAVEIGLAVSIGLLVVAMAMRTALVGHAPWSTLHGFSATFAAALVVVYLLLRRSYAVGGLAPLVALLAAGLVGFALGLDDATDPLVPALQQPLLLTIHVGTAALSYAVAGVAFVAAAAELGQRRAGGTIPGLADVATLRAVGHRAVLIAFPLLTTAIALGSLWANLAWRSYWSNDPKELAAAATWLVFGAYLHVASRRDRWEALAPWLIVLGFVGVLFTYVGASIFIVGEHSYAAP